VGGETPDQFHSDGIGGQDGKIPAVVGNDVSEGYRNPPAGQRPPKGFHVEMDEFTGTIHGDRLRGDREWGEPGVHKGLQDGAVKVAHLRTNYRGPPDPVGPV
jgi:hypothetical protein